jgi:flagellar M-ring protein FliF
LRANLERLLEARVGVGKAIVEVTVEVDTTREEISERVFDPAGRVAISSETEERSGSSGRTEGQVTVASNLPEGDAGQGPQEQSQSSETRERVNYEVSETSRAVLRSPGATAKISVAVLLDDMVVIAADGTETREARSVAISVSLRELVASAMGFDESRGDVLTVKSLAFQPTAQVVSGTEAPSAAWIGPIDLMRIVQVAVFAVVTLILGLFVVRPILAPASRRLAQITAEPRPLALTAAAVSSSAASTGNSGGNGVQAGALTGEIQDEFALSKSPTRTIESPPEIEPTADHVSRLRRLIESRQTESIEILRGWMEKEEQAT